MARENFGLAQEINNKDFCIEKSDEDKKSEKEFYDKETNEYRNNYRETIDAIEEAVKEAGFEKYSFPVRLITYRLGLESMKNTCFIRQAVWKIKNCWKKSIKISAIKRLKQLCYTKWSTFQDLLEKRQIRKYQNR